MLRARWGDRDAATGAVCVPLVDAMDCLLAGGRPAVKAAKRVEKSAGPFKFTLHLYRHTALSAGARVLLIAPRTLTRCRSSGFYYVVVVGAFLMIEGSREFRRKSPTTRRVLVEVLDYAPY